MATVALGVMIASAAVSAPTAAQAVDSTALHPAAREAIGHLWSPYCPGMMLEVCPSPGGAMLRDSIQAMALRGLPADSIVERVLAEYGEEYRAEPKVEGVGGLAWFIPPMALVAGLVIVAVLLARRRRGAVAGPTAPPSDEDAARLREAMARLDAEERPDF
jgi:cytochrome c-type biogenesis protein CcmH